MSAEAKALEYNTHIAYIWHLPLYSLSEKYAGWWHAYFILLRSVNI